MKSELKAKFLQHLASKKSDNAGFTLIELLVVIIIIGILSAIALPSFLNQANKARQSEAKTYIGSMNRAQQAYYLENAQFVSDQTSFEDLAMGISTETDNYTYRVSTKGGNTLDAVQSAETTGTKGAAAAQAAYKAYGGGVSISQLSATSTESSSLAVLCEGVKAPVNGGATGAAADVAAGLTFATDAAPVCGGTYKSVGS